MAIQSFVSIGFGLLYAGTLMRRSVGYSIPVGILYGAAIFLLMEFVILPRADPILRVSMPPWPFLLSHFVYGVTLALALPRWSHVSARRRSVRTDVAAARVVPVPGQLPEP